MRFSFSWRLRMFELLLSWHTSCAWQQRQTEDSVTPYDCRGPVTFRIKVMASNLSSQVSEGLWCAGVVLPASLRSAAQETLAAVGSIAAASAPTAAAPRGMDACWARVSDLLTSADAAESAHAQLWLLQLLIAAAERQQQTVWGAGLTADELQLPSLPPPQPPHPPRPVELTVIWQGSTHVALLTFSPLCVDIPRARLLLRTIFPNRKQTPKSRGLQTCVYGHRSHAHTLAWSNVHWSILCASSAITSANAPGPVSHAMQF